MRIWVEPVGVEARIGGGDRSVTRDDDLVLDARSSVDLDGFGGSFSYTWARGTPCMPPTLHIKHYNIRAFCI